MAEQTRMEFAVQMTCQSCADAVYKALSGKPGVQSVDIKLQSEQVIVKTSLPTDVIKSMIESTGRVAVLQGFGGTSGLHLGAAVAAMDVGAKEIRGVVRMVQTSEDSCLFEGTVDGLPPGHHSLCVHEKGDISDGCTSCGDVFGAGETEKAKGILQELEVGESGHATFQFSNKQLKVWDLIGRSLIIHKGSQMNSVNNRLVCGIIARSAGLFENSKRLCTCDGVSIWEERNRPVAGEGRRQESKI
ncbi:LOW QUALITY PROTEIN: copper chaperone for superoxide dismutase-like [Pomacea canaliculata]|uniref:LOW QUALITY PROTEIN: copper chaperone for superoxide dismutase-like n=1 Tax=Pomacea canaliculata TaxID=400727 RepID=UPI000D72B9DF|nr:LOW QUALITY PROTEIN: copper chaperone for superoxide dismutase-like [Pomacea canaliculata]